MDCSVGRQVSVLNRHAMRGAFLGAECVKSGWVGGLVVAAHLADCLNRSVPPDGGILLLLRQKKYPRKGDPCAAAPLRGAPSSARSCAAGLKLVSCAARPSLRTSRPDIPAPDLTNEAPSKGED